jgi:copper homeostasis protein CutC
MDRRTVLKAGLGAAGYALSRRPAFAETKQRSFELEIIASSLEDAAAAHQGGATRIELAVHLEKGGLSPSLDLARTIISEVPIAVRIMIRESEGFTLNGSEELRSLAQKEEAFLQLPINGFVLGYLQGGRIDVQALRELIAAAPSAHYTVHNAIEMTADPIETLRTLRTFPQVDRALVCACMNVGPGDSRSLTKRIERLKSYQEVWEHGDRRLLVNGLRVDELKQVQREAGIREFHLSEQVNTPERSLPQGAVDAGKVREVVALLSRS